MKELYVSRYFRDIEVKFQKLNLKLKRFSVVKPFWVLGSNCQVLVRENVMRVFGSILLKLAGSARKVALLSFLLC